MAPTLSEASQAVLDYEIVFNCPDDFPSMEEEAIVVFDQLYNKFPMNLLSVPGKALVHLEKIEYHGAWLCEYNLAY